MKKNLLCIDLGKGSMGVALSRTGMFVTPVTNLRFGLNDWDKPIAYLHELKMTEKIETFVLGLPLFPSGDDCEMTLVVRKFAKRLEKEFPGIEIVYQDERYSTIDASAYLHEKGERSKKQHKSIDQTAACVILERYLQSIGQAD